MTGEGAKSGRRIDQAGPVKRRQSIGVHRRDEECCIILGVQELVGGFDSALISARLLD